MLVNLKTIAGQAFQLDCDSCSTLAEIKLKISAVKGSENFPVELQKLFYNGKVRGDDEKLSDLKIDEDGDKKHIIIMCPTVKVKPPTTENKETTAKRVIAPEEEKDVKAAVDINPATSVEELLISQIQDKGYTREKAISALKVSKNNIAEAIQFLILQESGQSSEEFKPSKEVPKNKVSFASPLPDTAATRKQERMKRFGLDIKSEADLNQKSVQSPKVIKDEFPKIEIVEKTLRSDQIIANVLLGRSERFKDKEFETDDVYAEKKKARLKRFGIAPPETEILEKRAKRFASSDEC